MPCRLALIKLRRRTQSDMRQSNPNRRHTSSTIRLALVSLKPKQSPSSLRTPFWLPSSLGEQLIECDLQNQISRLICRVGRHTAMMSSSPVTSPAHQENEPHASVPGVAITLPSLDRRSQPIPASPRTPVFE